MSGLPPAPNPAVALSRIYDIYAALVSRFPLHEESGLGGKLLFAGSLKGSSPDLLYAANIAGAASLAASADAELLKAAIRSGVVDFAVTSLSEALRILKNEIRKHQAVSVAVSVPPAALVKEMLDRGVLPDIVPPAPWPESESGLLSQQRAVLQEQGSTSLTLAGASGTFFVWSVNMQPSRILPRLDLLAQSVLPQDDLARHRWVRHVPRYLGRLAQRQHGVALSAPEVQKLRDLTARFVYEEISRMDPGSEPLIVQIVPAR